MYSLSVIKKINSVEYTTGVKPKAINEPADVFSVPNASGKVLNEHGYVFLESLFCDSSGIGLDSEPALTKNQLIQKITSLIAEHGVVYGVIVSESTFQIYLNIYLKKSR